VEDILEPGITVQGDVPLADMTAMIEEALKDIRRKQCSNPWVSFFASLKA